MAKDLKKELDSFQTIWKKGYYEGSVLDETAPSAYGKIGYMSNLYATYLRCIKPYVNKDTVALEIGPGRGAWTKTMLQAREIVTLDALSAEHNEFWEYIGPQKHVTYHQVKDFEGRELPDNHFNYMFSFGCLCHVSFEGISAYAKNLFPKLKSGAQCFWMVADYDKYNSVVDRQDHLDMLLQLLRHRMLFRPFYYLLRLTRKRITPKDKNEHNEAFPGRWYNADLERCCKMLEANGYQVLDSDVGTVSRDPIIHFMKP